MTGEKMAGPEGPAFEKVRRGCLKGGASVHPRRREGKTLFEHLLDQDRRAGRYRATRERLENGPPITIPSCAQLRLDLAAPAQPISDLELSIGYGMKGRAGRGAR